MKSNRRSVLKRTLGLVKLGLQARGLRWGEAEKRSLAARRMSASLSGMHGLPRKVGQVLSMSSRVETRVAMAGLGRGEGVVAIEEIRDTLEHEWRCPPEEVLASIEPEGLSASLGQVHRARLRDGRDVAIKVRLPGIEEAVRSDLRGLGWLGAPLGMIKGIFDLGAYQAFMEGALEEELDYRQEARNQRDMASRAPHGLIVPEVVSELSTSCVLTMGWEEGSGLEEARGWSVGERRRLAGTLLEHFLHQAFETGLVHADPHPGNYAFRRERGEARVVLYDHGSVLRLTDRERLLVLRLIEGACRRDAAEDPLALLVELGFNRDLLHPLREKIPPLCTVLFEPFAQVAPFDLSTWERGGRARDILGEDRMQFRAAGPPRLVFFLRALEGLCFYLRELGEPVSWGRPFQLVRDRHLSDAQALPLSEAEEGGSSYSSLATSLHVQIDEQGTTRARVSLPAASIERLPELMEENVLTAIRRRGLDLEEMVREARRGGYAPGEIFQLEEDGKCMRVWLE